MSHTVDKDLMEARQLTLESRWPEAIKVLEGVQSRLEPGFVFYSLRRPVARALESYKKKEEEREIQEEKQKRRSATGNSSSRSTRPASRGPRMSRRAD